MRRIARQSGPGLGELGLDAAHLEPVDLFGVDPPKPSVHRGTQCVQILGQADRQVERHRAQPARHGQLGEQIVGERLDDADAVLVLD